MVEEEQQAPSAPSPIIEKLKVLRTRKDLKLKPTPLLKQTFTDFSGTERELAIRYYQVQGILHLVYMKRFLLGDDTGLGKCKPLDSLVLTDRGLLRLGEMAPGGGLVPDQFYPLKQPTSVWTGFQAGWQPIKHYYCGGTKPTKRVVTRRGYETAGSWVHPLWVRRQDGEQFQQLRDVQPGEYACLSRTVVDFPHSEPSLPLPDRVPFDKGTKFYQVPDKLTPELARLLGYIVAEGWTNGRYGVQIAQDQAEHPEVHADIAQLCLSVLGKAPAEGQSKDLTIQLSSVYLRAYLQGLGVERVLSAGKCVPWPIFQGTAESVAEFLRGYFDGEASVCSDVLEVSSASERLLREVQILLLRFGILSSRNPKVIKGKTYWRLALCGQDAVDFGNKIGLLTPCKMEALRNLCAKSRNANLDVVPFAQAAVDALRVEIKAGVTKTGHNDNRKGSGIKQFGTSFEKTLNNIRNGGRNPTYSFLEHMLQVARQVGASDTAAYAEVQDICTHRFFYDPVVRVSDGEEPVADIEVDDPSHSFVADGFINHNTLQAIAALCLLWSVDPSRKALVLTTKSATPQWAKEFGKFTKGVRVIVANGDRKQREAAYAAWRKGDKPTVMIMGYRSAVNDLRKIQHDHGFILIADEATAFKNIKTQVHQVARHLSAQADRTWALTATLIKNHLLEGHGIFQVVVPGLFGNYNNFMYYYCIVEMMQLGGGRKVPRVVGYFPEKVKEFRERMSPYYLGRPKHEVADELPILTRDTIEVGVTPEQEAKYREAMTKLLLVGEKKGEEVEKEVTKLTALIYHQEILDHPSLIDCVGESEKLNALIEMLTEGNLADEKVIIFTRFSKMVDILMPALTKAELCPVRVTGAETGDQRQKAQDAFQDPKNPCRAICITSAGGEAINLQAAKAIVFYDTPWSAGEYLQCLDAQTEILTQRGFVGRKAIREDDLTAALDRHTSTITWQHIRSIVDRPLAVGEAMYELCSPHLDIRVTGGHRMLFKRQNSTTGKRRYWPAEWRVQAASDLAAEKSVYRLPACGVEEAAGVPLTDDELRFIGWFLTDGTLNKKTQQVVVYQAEHQPQIKDLRQCLAGCGFDWKEYPRDPTKITGTYPNGRPLTAFTIPKGTGSGSRKRNGWGHLATYLDKELSPLLEALDARQVAVLLEAIHLGDGAKMLGQTWTRRSYHVATGSKVFADRLQSLCVRRGFRCNVAQRPGKQTFTLHVKPTGFWSLQGSTLQHRPRMVLSPSVPGEPVWCVENDVGTLITRRNGKVAVVGNCLGRMIRIGSAHDRVYALHMVAKVKGVPTVDQKVMEVIERKLKLIEAVLGERLKGKTDAGNEILEVTSDINDIYDAMKKASHE